MSPAWYEYQPEAITIASGDDSPEVILPVTPAYTESVSEAAPHKSLNAKEFNSSLPEVHPLHANGYTALIKPLPAQRACYCCKGTDYWLAGTERYPHWVCRRCHPPVPGMDHKP